MTSPLSSMTSHHLDSVTQPETSCSPTPYEENYQGNFQISIRSLALSVMCVDDEDATLSASPAHIWESGIVANPMLKSGINVWMCVSSIRTTGHIIGLMSILKSVHSSCEHDQISGIGSTKIPPPPSFSLERLPSFLVEQQRWSSGWEG